MERLLLPGDSEKRQVLQGPVAVVWRFPKDRGNENGYNDKEINDRFLLRPGTGIILLSTGDIVMHSDLHTFIDEMYYLKETNWLETSIFFDTNLIIHIEDGDDTAVEKLVEPSELFFFRKTGTATNILVVAADDAKEVNTYLDSALLSMN